MLNIILVILAVIYSGINLIMFGMTLPFLPTKNSLIYLFFGTFVVINEYFIELWKK